MHLIRIKPQPAGLRHFRGHVGSASPWRRLRQRSFFGGEGPVSQLRRQLLPVS
jgi:hypothetical protein